jgi:hypothetical protein
MKPLGLSVNKLALDLHVPATRLARLSMNGGVLPQTLLCAWRGTSKRMLSFG